MSSLVLKNIQAKVLESSRSDDCPRSNGSSSVLLRRNRIWNEWTGMGKITLIPRTSTSIRSGKKIKTKSKQRLSGGFFQAQLRMIKSGSLKLTQLRMIKSKKGSINLSTNQINHSYQIGSRSSPILKRHRRNMIGDQKTGSSIHDLPKELLAEILVRLPVKCILCCRGVQKSWKSFIQSPLFITLHLNYHKKMITHQHTPRYLFFEDQFSVKLTLRFDHVQCEEYCRLEFLPGLPHDAWFAVSYGLVCASTMLLTRPNESRNIYLWNPLVKKYKTLPHSPLPSSDKCRSWESLAFGFLPQVNDYVVVHIIKPYMPPNPHSVIIGVYSLNTNSWKKLTIDNVFISGVNHDDHDAVFANGAAFWVGVNSHNHRILLCFDTRTDILSEISLPDWVAFLPHVPVIHKFGESIAYFVWESEVSHFDMWVLKYDPINEFTWEKKLCVSLGKDVREEVLGVRNNGEPLLAKSNNLISYSLESHQAKDFVDSWDRWTTNFPYEAGYAPRYVVSPFVESLVLLDNN